MKSIIDDWNNELNAHSRAFMADAQSLAEWDQHIRRKRRELLEMEAHLNRVCLQYVCICSSVACIIRYAMLTLRVTNAFSQHNNTGYHICANQLQLAMHMMSGCTGWTSKYCAWVLQTV